MISYHITVVTYFFIIQEIKEKEKKEKEKSNQKNR